MRRNRISASLLAFVVSVALIVSAVPAWAATESNNVYEEVRDILSEKHVSGIDKEQLNAETIEGLVEQVNDPYTDYMDKEEYDSFRNSIEQNYVGIGVRISQDDHGVFVVEVFPNSPAAAADMKPGDYIVAVNGVSADGKTTDEIVSEITGPEGTSVKVTVLRGTENLVLAMERRAIQVPVVTARWFEQDRIGYLKITSFSFDLGAVLAKELERLDGQGMEALVLDLRNNPGGYLHAAAAMIRHFVEEGTLIHTKDRDGIDSPLQFSNGRTAPYPVYILVNENSASASEVFAGAMQDYDAGIVIGRNTYGKGSVQQLEPLSDGGVLKVTVEEYLTPNYRQVNGVGIQPDIDVHGAVPQLLSALKEAGIGALELEFTKQGVSVNGQAFLDAATVLEHDGAAYVPSRVLAALLNAELRWDGATRTVVVETDDATSAFKSDGSELLNIRGTTYLELGEFQKRFPAFSWTNADGRLILKAE